MSLRNKLAAHWKRRGARHVLTRAAGRVIARFYRLEHDQVYVLEDAPSVHPAPSGYDLVLREAPPDDRLAWSPDLHHSPRVVAARFDQGARRYAAVWNGQGVDVCWAITGRRFQDRAEGFALRLGARECYVFDYQGFRQGRPPAFRRFALMKALVTFVIDQETRRLGEPLRFYSIVDQENRASVYFHARVLGARPAGAFRTRRLLGRPALLLSGDAPPIVCAASGAP